MKLQEFIDFRKNCPICDTKLITGFHSRRKQNLKFVNDRLSVTFDLDSLNKKQKDYKVSYSFGLQDNSFCAEFHYEDGSPFENHSPVFLIERFKELHKNLKAYKFYRGCSFCRKYCYGSKLFHIDLKSSSFYPLEVWAESVVLTQPIQDGYRVYRMINALTEKNTELVVWNQNDDYVSTESSDVPARYDRMDLPLIPFVSKEETLERLKRLIVFS